MKKFFDSLFSMQLTVILLLMFAISAGMATFIENDFGTSAARIAVYGATWFEILLVLLAINLGGSLIVNRIWQHKKYFIFVFHLSFIIILLGAAITRYFGFEGMMHIGEGETSNEMVSDQAYITAKFSTNTNSYTTVSRKVIMSGWGNNRFSFSFDLEGKDVEVETVDFAPNASKGAGQHSGQDAVVVNVSVDDKTREVIVWGKRGLVGEFEPVEIDGLNFGLAYGSAPVKLPFLIKLNKFILDRYPGSNSPSSYASEVTLIDETEGLSYNYRIFMNHILKHKGYRFYQSSYDTDEKGTILSVNHDGVGTTVTYIGYFFMSLAMILALFSRKTRFGHVLRQITETRKKRSALLSIVLVLFLLSGSGMASAQQTKTIHGKQVSVVNKDHSARFGKLMVLSGNGRLEPMNTLSAKILRKFTGKGAFEGLNSDQILLGIIAEPDKWQTIPVLKVKNDDLKKLINIKGNYASFADFFNFSQQNNYLLTNLVDKAYQKESADQTKFDKEVINADEKVNIFYLVYSGSFLSFFPKPDNPVEKWFNPVEPINNLPKDDSLFIKNITGLYISALINAFETGDYTQANEMLGAIEKYQLKYAQHLLPSDKKKNIEIMYNSADIFERLFRFYGLVGVLFLVVLFANLVNPKFNFKWLNRVFIATLAIAFFIHTLGLAARWYISGHAPMSNGYESMIFIAWTTMFAGFLLVRNSNIALAATTVLASLTLFVAHLNWMNPEVTNLVPVLKSIWLTIHVAVITSSYGFLGLGAILGLFNLMLMIFQNKNNLQPFNLTIKEISLTSEATMTIGLYMLTIGTFLGAVWANESWGRYWGWDPKETWALVTVLVYAVIIHLNFIPGVMGSYLFNTLSVLGFSSVLMTYFGVNYYLSGLHSYAAGDPVPIPAFVYYTIAILIIILGLAFFKQSKLKQLVGQEK